MKEEDKENLKETLKTIGLLTTVTPLIAVFTLIRDTVSRIESDRFAAKEIKHNLEESWKTIYEVAINIQLKGDDLSGYEYLLKSFVMQCYDTENLLDKLELKIVEQIDASAFARVKQEFFDFFKQLWSPDAILKLQARLKQTETIWEDSLKKQMTTETDKSSRAHKDPYLKGVRIIGRETETTEIIDKLLSQTTKVGISIIGVCGLGKSSLAQTIMDDQRIRKKFNLRKKIKIDGKFVWDKKIKKEIEECLTQGTTMNWYRPGNLLIVFDNLADTDDFEWDSFLQYKKTQRFESVKFIITTRNPRTSGKTGTEPYLLKTLSDSQCEQVIKENAISDPNLSEQSLLSIISDFAKKCEGLPWIAQRLGNILRKRDDIERKALQENARLWHTKEFKTEFLPQFASCYKDIILELRRCFSYFSLFPSDHHFNPDELVRLWVAECFIQSKEIGEKYVNDLKIRSILQTCKQGYKLQSFGYDFATLATLGTCLHLDRVSSLDLLNENIRHLSLSRPLDEDIWSKLQHLKLRTFLSLYTELDLETFENIPSGMKKSLLHLRVLSLRNTLVNNLPEFIGELKLLRYLDVSFTSKFEALPLELDMLIALETLKVEGSKFKHWRNLLHKLTNLRYVDWTRSDLRQNGIPYQVGKLSLLESLPLFMVGIGDGYTIKELKELNKLKGSLWIENLQLVANEAEARLAMLHNKHELRTIKLAWNSRQREEDAPAHQREDRTSILTALKPCDNLRELILRYYEGDDLPEWISESKIETIKLENCYFSNASGFATALGKMKELRTLGLYDMENILLLESSSAGTGTDEHFPRLESVELHNMTQLINWTGVDDARDMPCLRQMKFVNCPKIQGFVDHLRRNRPSLEVLNEP